MLSNNVRLRQTSYVLVVEDGCCNFQNNHDLKQEPQDQHAPANRAGKTMGDSILLLGLYPDTYVKAPKGLHGV